MAQFFELPDGKIVCFNPGGRFHGWLFWRHPDGQFVSEQKLAEVSPPPDPLLSPRQTRERDPGLFDNNRRGQA